MTRINLLPWRAIRRKELERQFYSILAGIAILMALAILYVHLHINGMINSQNERNSFLQTEITKLDEKIKEINALENEKAKLMARINIIEELEGQRPQVVYLLSELAHRLPDGVYLTEIKQNQATITLKGVADSNARISTFMRDLDDSEWLENPRLEIITGKEDKQSGIGHRTSEFTLHITQTGIKTPEPASSKDTKTKGAKPAAQNQPKGH